MADQPRSNSSTNWGKWIVIGAILLFIGIFVFEGVQQKWLNLDTLKNMGGYLKNSTFWLNVVIITTALALIAYILPPFKQTLQSTETTSASYVLLAVILIISIFAAVQLGNTLIYKHKLISWILPEEGGQFNFKPLTNVGIFWIFFTLLLPLVPLPHIQPVLQKFFQQEKENLKAAPYIIMLLLSLMVAFQLGGVGIWEKETFISAEHFFLGERAAGGGLFDTHTGVYKNSAGETRYGIFKTKVTGPDGDVFPLGVLGVVLTGLYLISIFKLKELNQLGGWKLVIFFAIAASAANRGVSLQGIITIAYFAGVFFTKDFIKGTINDWDSGVMKKYLPWIGGIIVAEYAAEMVNPLTSPPYLPGGVIGKTILLSIIIIAFNFVSNTYNSAVKAGLRFGVCQNCGRPCKKDQGTYICNTPGCPANSCQEITGIDVLSTSIGIRIGAALKAFITGMISRNRDEARDVDAADAAAGGAETPIQRRARLEARREEIERALEDHRTGTHLLTGTQRNNFETELREITLELRGLP